MNSKAQAESFQGARLYIAKTSPVRVSPPARLRRNGLTDREQETLGYIAAGFTADEIGRQLYISKETVDTHRKNIIKKLGVSNVTAAVAHAIRNNLIS